MCGRYAIENLHVLGELLRQLQIEFQMDFEPNPTWNAAPSQHLPVIVEDEGIWHLRPMQWGLIPKWTKPGEKPRVAPINARAETLSEKPMFRSLIKRQRCLVPANGFYEWKRTGGPKQPYFIFLRDEPIMLMAGLYDHAKQVSGDPLQSYTIITGGPNVLMQEIHDRMPMIIHPDDAVFWMDRDIEEPEALAPLLQPIAADEMEMIPVSTSVNNVRNNGPELIEPIAEQEGLL